MVKKTLIESFEIKPRNVINTNVKDYDVFSDKKLLEVGEVYGYSKIKSFFKIRLPYAVADILVGMRIGLGYSWRAIISAEMIAASTGLGHMILFAQQMSRTDKVIVGILVIGVVGYITDRLFALIIDKTLKGSQENGWD